MGMKLSLTLESAIIERLDALVGEVASSPSALEFGVRVDRRLVARMALLKGLSVLEGSAAPPVSKSESAAKPVESPPDAPIERDSAGFIKPPEGWSRWSKGERFPESQREAHEYYAGHGWERWWGKSGDEVIAFYWSPDSDLHDVPVFSGVGPGGEGVLVQDTPYGPGHLIPAGWG
jgi:hypothetical protein